MKKICWCDLKYQMNASVLLAVGLWLPSAQAACDTSRSDAFVGSYASFEVDDGRISANKAPFHAGLACVGFAAALNSTFMRYQIEELSPYLTSESGERLYFNVVDRSDGVIIKQGDDRDLSSFSLVTFFSGPDGAVQMNAVIPPGQSPVPGHYKGRLKVRWYYSVPSFAMFGMGGFHESPRFNRGGVFGRFDWGSGQSSSMVVSLNVVEDCVINAQDIEFGEAALSTRFEPNTGTIRIKCSAKTPYDVGLSNGRSGSNRRYMTSSYEDRLYYDVYKGNSIDRWGMSGSARWSSSQASANAGLYDGKTTQSYVYTAKVLPGNNPNLPAGSYRDSLVLDVQF